ncbi:MAG: hypothetical protein KDD64_08815 [Bdellovibrionales bacterium]|nr:hypothetical protein [Bdellovibrionales bacterium]
MADIPVYLSDENGSDLSLALSGEDGKFLFNELNAEDTYVVTPKSAGYDVSPLEFGTSPGTQLISFIATARTLVDSECSIEAQSTDLLDIYEKANELYDTGLEILGSLRDAATSSLSKRERVKFSARLDRLEDVIKLRFSRFVGILSKIPSVAVVCPQDTSCDKIGLRKRISTVAFRASNLRRDISRMLSVGADILEKDLPFGKRSQLKAIRTYLRQLKQETGDISVNTFDCLE